jgi:hypothetical protein
MELLTTIQYNQGIGKNKLLSSTAGVGSIVTTKIGYYILVSDINKWGFVSNSQKIISEIIKEETDYTKRYDKAKFRLPNQGIIFINDKRFVNFLREEQQLSELICLVGIPNISLNEHFNSPNWKNHPINRLLEGKGKAEDFMVKGTHFPKWFINDDGMLKTYSEWKRIWNSKHLKSDNFVPPRDATKPILAEGKPILRTLKDSDGVSYKIGLFKELNQTNLILICPNGHLSDIPWPKFLRWKSDRKEKNDNGESLFTLDDCCLSPKLKWTESKTKSEGYSSVYIECTNCGCGGGNGDQRKINLEGINNLKPCCSGHKPWEIDLSQDINSVIPYEECNKKGDKRLGREDMQVALVTGNNVYYANSFSSLFIPLNLAENKSLELIAAINKCVEKYNKYLKAKPGITKESFWTTLNKEDFIIENEFSPTNISDFILNLELAFLEPSEEDEDVDRYEVYRWQEYQCFCNNNRIDDKDGLKFNDIILPTTLANFFLKIQQVEELKVTQVQLDFTRVKPKERIRIENEIIESTSGKNIFSINKDELLVLPANETYGEGLFFQFNDMAIETWCNENEEKLKERYKGFLKEPDLNSQGASIKQKIHNNTYKHFLVHTFSHLIMRELEFSCGYPTASLKERLYISNRMSGVLIFTAEGAEGSMGGLVWQGQPGKIEELINKAIERSIDCSSDPLCWESEGQGIFDLNLAACFSCSLVSETACEEMNLGLDRQILVDAEFGFFKTLVN